MPRLYDTHCVTALSVATTVSLAALLAPCPGGTRRFVPRTPVLALAVHRAVPNGGRSCLPLNTAAVRRRLGRCDGSSSRGRGAALAYEVPKVSAAGGAAGRVGYECSDRGWQVSGPAHAEVLARVAHGTLGLRDFDRCTVGGEGCCNAQRGRALMSGVCVCVGGGGGSDRLTRLGLETQFFPRRT
jgi:hypothetical protein